MSDRYRCNNFTFLRVDGQHGVFARVGNIRAGAIRIKRDPIGLIARFDFSQSRTIRNAVDVDLVVDVARDVQLLLAGTNREAMRW